MIMRFFVFFVFFSVLGCENSDLNSTVVDVNWIYEANPVDDVKKAVEVNDFRFLGVYGYSLIVPGLKLECIDIEQDVKPIEGTSDSYSSYEEEKFNAVAKIYADYYNFQLMRHLKDNEIFNCNK